MLIKWTRIADPIKTFFLHFFGVKLGHFTINEFFSICNEYKSSAGKTEKIFVSKENKFYRVGF